MAKLDLNVFPYFDDFDSAKKYYQILFSPRIAVQTRELNQIQSIQNDQREKFASHIFKEGAAVKDGEINIDTDYRYIKVLAPGGSNLESALYRETNFHNKVIQGTSGVRAVVLNSLPPSGGQVTLYVKYLGQDTATGTINTFDDEEVVVVMDENDDPTAITATLAPSNSSGVGSAANVKAGIFYIRGKFIIADKQTIILEPFSNAPSYRIGFTIVESIVDSDDDPTLNDNAAGFNNENAPGAHRHKVELVLTKLSPGSQGTSDFVELAEVVNGELTKNTVAITQYSELEKTFARRTYDESGDYTVIAPKLDVREFYNDGSNRGIYSPSNFEYDTEEEAKQVSINRFGVASPGTAHQVSSKWRPGSSSANLVSLMKAKLALGIDPCKAYVRGFEIRTLARKYIDMYKARTFETANNSTIKTKIGNYIRITNLYGAPNIGSFEKVNLYDRFTSSPGLAAAGASIIGTARVRGIEYESGVIGTSAAIYKLFLFDIQIASGKNFYDTKQVFVSGFSADIEPEKVLMTGSVTVKSGDTTVVGTQTQWLASDTENLIVGDYIYTTTDAGDGIYIRVDGSVTNTSFACVDPEADITGQAFYYVFANLYEPQNSCLIFPLPKNPVKTVTSDGTTVDTNYVVRRYFAAQEVNGGGEIVISTSHADEVFLPFSNTDWMAFYTAGAHAGDIVALASSDLAYNGTDTQVTISGLESGENVAVIASVRKSQGTPSTAKTKSLNVGATITVSSDGGLNEISLGKADILRIQSIHMAPDFSTAPTTSHTNITDWYTLDNGQRDDFYDIGKIIRKPSYPKPTGRLLITFDYFSHGVNGNYFSVDTYTVISGVEYDGIPSYSSTALGRTFDLRDCLDFRPRVKDDASGFANSGGGSLVDLPNQGYVIADFQYYLNRIDKLYLDQYGDFHIIQGVDGLDPAAPDDPSDGMVTHKLNVRAYTLSTSDVIVDNIDNRRFTMRDIGKLEKRIENLEYYTSLSLLEKATQDMEILDSRGLDRFKNGFIVDPFNGHGIGDVLSDDYRCAIDMENGELRPMFWSDHVNLIEENTTDEDRETDHYMLTGDLFTLPYTEEVLVDQPVASNIINVNPFNVVSFVGDITLNPPNDEWKDTERIPDLIVNQEGNYDAIAALAEGQGTIWNEWQVGWTGTSSSKEVIDKRREYGDNKADAGHSHSWPVRTVKTVRTTTTITTNMVRTGVKAVVTPKIVTENLGDRVINVAYIPFIRSRDVEFRAKGMKPNTRLYPFFDEVPIDQYVSVWDDPTVPEAFDPNDTANITPIITDQTGKASGTFRIPNTDSLRFRTGERIFTLTSSQTNEEIDRDSFGTAFYRAQGLLETKQATILSTRNAEVSWEQVVDNKQITDTSVSDVVKVGKWVDPIAETFLVEKSGGVFLTSIDLYFFSKDPNIPVTLEIRETVNGYPGSKVLPFSRVVKEAADVQTSTNASAATRFTFPSPVYCRQGEEYCFVVMANTNKYQVWIATMGENKVGTEVPITDQPYNGSFFKSQNSSTWTADQLSDIKFKMNYAQFDISQPGTVILVNDELPAVELDADPIITRSGKSKVRIMHKNHGFRSDNTKQSKVTISGAVTTNGIDADDINGTHDIISCDLDSYIIDTGENATSTGRGGGANVIATENRQVDALQPVVGHIVLPGTSLNLSVKTTSSKSVHPGPSAGDLYITDSSFTPVIANETTEFNQPCLVASQDNEDEHLSGNKSFFLKAVLASSNSNISPVIDLQRLALITIGNRIDNPSATGDNSINDSDVDSNTILNSSANVVFASSGKTITTTNDGVGVSLSQIQAGKYITVSGTTSNNFTARVVSVVYTPGESTKITITVDASVVNETPGSATIVQHERFIDERAAKLGSISSKYLNRRMNLAQPSNGLKIVFSACKEPTSNLTLYYRVQRIDDPTPFEELPFTVATIDSFPGDSAHPLDFRDYEYTINNLPDFNVVQTKIGMTGSNTAQVPRIKDFRCIALGT